MLTKLRHLLSHPITQECQVVYFLVELRKVLELRVLLGQYTALKFYCDWAMHPRMDRAAAEEFLKRIDDVETADSFGMFGTGNQALAAAMDSLRQDAFRRDLREALLGLALQTEICTSNNLWVSFLELYAGVILATRFAAVRRRGTRRRSPTGYGLSRTATLVHSGLSYEIPFSASPRTTSPASPPANGRSSPVP